jgi:Protein of unknown function (DUF1569)
MRSLATPGVVGDLEARIRRLTPETTRRWGSLTSHEMVCHLADSFRAMLGVREVSPVGSPWLTRTAMRLVALHAPIRFPKDVPTRPEVDPHRGGTAPVSFDTDRRDLLDLLRRFVSPEARYAIHPIFGALTRNECLVWGYRHVDHHLRQFGL